MIDDPWIVTVLGQDGKPLEEGGPDENVLCAIPGSSFKVQVECTRDWDTDTVRVVVLYLDGKRTGKSRHFRKRGDRKVYDGWEAGEKSDVVVSQFLFAKPPVVEGGGRMSLDSSVGSLELKVFRGVDKTQKSGGLERLRGESATVSKITEKQAVKDGRGVAVAAGTELKRRKRRRRGTKIVNYNEKSTPEKLIRLIYRDPHFFDRLNGTNYSRLLMPDPGAAEPAAVTGSSFQPAQDEGEKSGPAAKKQRTSASTSAFAEGEIVDLT